METKSPPARLVRIFLCAAFALALQFSNPQQAKAQGTYINGDLGSFVSFVCGNFPTTNLAYVMQEILNQLLSIQAMMTGLGGQGGGIGNPEACIPGFPGVPQLPGLENFLGCFDFSGLANIGANIGSCLSGVLNQFTSLSEYFTQFEQWNLQNIMGCLQGLVTIPTITLPDFLNNLQSILANIIALINSVQVNLPTYDGFYNFFLGFCQENFGSSGFVTGGDSGGSFSNTVSVNGSTINVSAAPIGGAGPAAAIAMPSGGAAAVLLPKKKGKGKRYAMACGATVCKRKIKAKRGTYTVLVEVYNGSIPMTVSKTSVTIK